MALDAVLFKQKIEALPEGKDLLEFYHSSVEAEKQRGIEESRKANSEAQNLRKFKIAFEKLGFQKDTDELDAFIESLKTTKSKAGEAETAKLSLEEVTKKLNELQGNYQKTVAELAAEKKQAAETKQNLVRKTIKSKLIEVLQDKVYGHDFVAEGLINENKVVLGDNDTIEFVEGDKRVPLEKGVENLLSSRTDIVKNTQRPGAASRPPSSGTAKKYTLDQITTMSKEDIKANLSDIKESLGIRKI